jgi:hypothetical protein
MCLKQRKTAGRLLSLLGAKCWGIIRVFDGNRIKGGRMDSWPLDAAVIGRGD